MTLRKVKKQIDVRWIAFIILCLGTLMEVLDSTIVNVALPSIRADLGFTESTLAWVVNAYLLTFGGFLLLGGRLGDIFGQRKLFMIGVSIFTIASLVCGISKTQEMLIIARAFQGVGGAITAAVSLSLVMNLFTKPDERAKAMGYFGFIAAGGGAIGVVLGGFITSAFNWHWNFLINVPIGILVVLLSRKYLPMTKSDLKNRSIDIWGAITITASLMLQVYAIVNGNRLGWTSPQTIGMLTIAAILMIAFLVIESRVKAPLLPLKLFKIRSLVSANIIGILWAGAMFAWFFLSALYLQLILHYTPLQVGLAFLPANLIMAVFSIAISAKLVMRFGIRKPLATGLLLASLGLFLFVVAPVGGSFAFNVMPSMILLGVGAGMAFNPVLLAAMSGVKPEESGLASGIVNTSFMMGGALGLAVLASLAASRTLSLLAQGEAQTVALNSGYHLAFLVGALFAFCAAVIAIIFLKIDREPTENVNVH